MRAVLAVLHTSEGTPERVCGCGRWRVKEVNHTEGGREGKRMKPVDVAGRKLLEVRREGRRSGLG